MNRASIYLKNQEYPAQWFGISGLSIISSSEFSFYRCVEFCDEFYEKPIIELHKGNLRESISQNRYSTLFPSKKVSYWSDSEETARAESERHGHKQNFLVFHAYDDSSSVFPITGKTKSMVSFVDGRNTRFHEILEKHDNNLPLTADDILLLQKIARHNPDALLYRSVANPNGVNFLFFESGFNKLALRKVSLQLSKKSKEEIICSEDSDCLFNVDAYGYCFRPIIEVCKDSSQFQQSPEYNKYIENQNYWIEQLKKKSCPRQERREYFKRKFGKQNN